MKISTQSSSLAVALAILVGQALPLAAQSPAPEGAKVYFIMPKDGDEISGPVTVKFGLAGMGVAPAGVDKKHTGHHHLLIDVEKVDLSAALPADDNHKHFGGGQTETSLTLKPGKHTLQLLLGDHNHVPHTPPVMSEKIAITVK